MFQIAFSANSMRLSEKKIYPKLFRTCYSESIGNPARIAFLKRFQWKKVATIYQDEGLFSLVSFCYFSKKRKRKNEGRKKQKDQTTKIWNERERKRKKEEKTERKKEMN